MSWSRASRQAALLATITLVMMMAPVGSQANESAGRQLRVDAPPPAAPAAVSSFRSVRGYDEVAVPVRLRIPAIHVDTTLQRLGRAPDGTVAVPDRFDVAGWYGEGPRPGQPGPAVILGHVDSRAGPAVFFDLSTLRADAVVDVDRADGSSVSFRVTALSRVPKTGFPTDLVYSPTLEPSLRLVTCGGSFDHQARSYRDNVIVYAVPS